MKPHEYGDPAEDDRWTAEQHREGAAGYEVEIEGLRRQLVDGEDVRHTLIRKLGYLGRCRRILGEPERAIEALGEAIELGASVELCPVCTHLVMVEIGFATRSSGDLETSEAVLQQLVGELDAHGEADPELAAVARVELGTTIVRRGEGRQDEAAAAIMPAIPLLEQIDAAKSTDHTKSNLAAGRAQLGTALAKAGQYAMAIPLLRRSHVAYRELGDKRTEVNNQVVLAGALAGTGSREAFGHYEEAIAAFHGLEGLDEDDHGIAHYDLAGAYIALDEDDERIERAARELKAALRVRRAIGAHEDVADTCQLLALLLDSEEESQALLDEAKTIRARLADQAGLAEALQFEGRNRRMLGLDREARSSYLGAIACVEAVRARLETAAGRATLIAAHRTLYAECALLHLDLGFEREAFAFSEASRGRSLVDVQAAEMPGLDVEPAFREERHRLAGAMTERTLRLRELGREALDAGASPGEEAARLEAELAELERRWEELEARMVAESPRFAARARTGLDSIWPARRVQEELLDEDQALLEYLVEDGDCVLFCLTAEEFRVVRMEGRWPELEAMVEALGSALEGMEESYPCGHELYRELVAPVEGMLAGKRELLISADDELHRLPFATLLRRPEPAAAGHAVGGWSGLPYLVEDFEIRYVASATSYAMLREAERAETLGAERDLLALAASLESADGEHPDGLAPLPQARAELDRVVAHFDRDRVRRLPEPAGSEPVAKATAVALMTEPGTAYRYLHLAAHAIADDRRPWQAAVVFDDGGPDDHLTARELLDLRLPARNVTLSGCQTVGTQVIGGEGIVGLALALRHAGARSVCASWWPVFDRSTMELMDGFYAALAGPEPNGTTVAAALRQAQRSLIAAGYHPRHWAAFGAFG